MKEFVEALKGVRHLLTGNELAALENLEAHAGDPERIPEPRFQIRDSRTIHVDLPASEWFRRNFLGILHP